ncbi:hypothetical protein KIL84_009924 [Mauremys mutica]|uniref:Uncharacterized protein n=1 Tax=Mauremys mutica TaxID=74926 RepID=A0A9D3XN64_9SAUR|nr:hypothetical protein KIL84_009924 [Mauremys mutica]
MHFVGALQPRQPSFELFRVEGKQRGGTRAGVGRAYDPTSGEAPVGAQHLLTSGRTRVGGRALGWARVVGKTVRSHVPISCNCANRPRLLARGSLSRRRNGLWGSQAGGINEAKQRFEKENQGVTGWFVNGHKKQTEQVEPALE